MDKPNILIDALPDTVIVDGRAVSIRTDFRICIMFEQLVFDPELSGEEMTVAALNLFYEQIPENAEAAIEAILWFYACGKTKKDEKPKNGKSQQKSTKYYDFDVDAGMIYAAFLDQYGIDLTSSDLHWWKFHALFAALKPDNEFCRIVEYRSVDLSKIKNKSERSRLAALKNRYALKSSMTVEQRVAMAGNAFS